MIADIKPYAEYQESGLPWLGQVPGHWDVRKPRHIGSLHKGGGGTKEDALSAGVPCVRYGELYTTHNFFVRKPKAFIHPDRASNYTQLHYGDVLFAASGETLEEIGKSAVNLIEGTAVCGGDVIILRPTVPVHAPFLGYVMDCRPSANQKATMGRGTTVKHIYPDELKNLLFPFPPVPEQAAIVRFLDWSNARLDRAIRAKRKVIALLNEQKQAIIHRAVTRGLDPSVPLRPSGIPWLGDIPQHWDTPLNQRIFKEHIRPHNGASETQLSLSQRDGLVATRDMRERSLQTASFDNWKVTLPGDLVLNRFKAHLGVFFAATLRGIVSFHYGVFAPLRQMHSKYFELLFHTHAYRAIYAGCSNGMTVGLQNLSNQNFYNVRSVVPPLSEQVAIVEHAERETQTLNTAISRLEREIDLLREYRTRLVADVVTGKLDVREAAARLPDEAAPDTVEDDTDLSLDPEAADEDPAA
ncbi:MAG: restriction endonuclease subunit S [Ardenticatenales bacterium]|nr:restriction endonuclease subunit S [Ardenticatenales bacterium]